MEGTASISADILARYAADAAREVAGVSRLVDSHLHRQRATRIVEGPNGVEVELHIGLEWGRSAPDVARAVQRAVRDYLGQMTDVTVRSVDVVVAEVD